MKRTQQKWESWNQGLLCMPVIPDQSMVTGGSWVRNNLDLYCKVLSQIFRQVIWVDMSPMKFLHELYLHEEPLSIIREFKLQQIPQQVYQYE